MGGAQDVNRVRRVLSAARVEAFRACRRRGRFDVDDVLDYVVGALALDAVERTYGAGDAMWAPGDSGEDYDNVPVTHVRSMNQSVVAVLAALDPAIIALGADRGKVGATARARARLAAILP